MDQSCLVLAVQAGGYVGYFLGKLSPLVTSKCYLNTTAHLSIGADHLHPFMIRV